MPISLPGVSTGSGGSGVGTRIIGTVALDDNVNAFVEEIHTQITRDIQSDRILNRYGRITRIREDYKPTVIDVKGIWRDGGGKYWRDFKAALYTQQQVNFTLGDGTRWEMVDVIDITESQQTSAKAGTSTPDQAFKYLAKVQTYEAFARETGPTLQSTGSLVVGTSNFTVNCVGSVFSEPTWQVQMVVPNGTTVTQVKIQNSTSGETCTVLPSGVTNGTFYVLMDASGGVVPSTGTVPTPGNNGYGLLATNSFGYGCTLYPSGGAPVDQDYTGRIPTLIPSPSPSVPVANNPNSIAVTIAATGGGLTSAALSVLAPARYIR